MVKIINLTSSAAGPVIELLKPMPNLTLAATTTDTARAVVLESGGVGAVVVVTVGVRGLSALNIATPKGAGW